MVRSALLTPSVFGGVIAGAVFAWRLRKVRGSRDERFVLEVLETSDAETWSGDGEPLSESDARMHASKHGISVGAFDDAVARARAQVDDPLDDD
jgi:hypothetical protein